MTIADVIADLPRRYDEAVEPFTSAEIDALCERLQLPRQRFFDEISVEIARSFDAGKLNFEAADFAMNDLWTIAVHDDEQLTPLLDEIYNAFDAGEYASPLRPPHDPIETHTRPMVKRILERLASN